MEKLKEADWRKLVGAFIMIAFAAIAMIRWTNTHIVFFLLLAFRDLIFAYFFFVRKESTVEESMGNRMFSYLSTALPLFYLHATTSSGYLIVAASLLSISGFLISTLATIELADRVGIAPAKRGDICRTGVYCYIKHPMYTGYVISEFGNILLNPLNALIFVFSIAGYWMRGKLENRTLARG